MSSWEFGWEALVAIGTLTLAFFTWRLARQTGDLARETANEVRSNARPVLVAAAGTGARLEVGGPSDRDYGTLVIPVRNAGRGPALNAFAYAHHDHPRRRRPHEHRQRRERPERRRCCR
jgi:hypothetical protein